MPRYENIKNLIAELTELNCTNYTIYNYLHYISQEPKEFRCLMTSDSQRMSKYFLQAAFKTLSLMTTFKNKNKKTT